MALLTVAPYDPWKQTAWVGDLIKLSAQMREEKAKREQQAQQQVLADQRRAFEFDRRMEFDRARTAADDNRADSRLAMERQIFNEDRAPFTLPSSLGPGPSGGPTLPTDSTAGPSASLPTLNTNDTPTPTDEPVDNSDAPSFLPPVATMPEADPDPDGAATRAAADAELLPGRPGDPPDVRRTKSGAPVVINGPVSGGVVAPRPSASLPNVTAATGVAGEPSLFPSADVPAGAQKTAAGSHVAALARDLAGTGLFTHKQATTILQQAAAAEGSRKADAAAGTKPTVRNFADGTTQQFMGNDANGQPIWKKLAEKQTAESETLQDVVGDAVYNKEHGTYVRGDGSEFFPQKSANGKWMQRPFIPSQKPAKLLWGDDGNIYPVDQQGNYLKPKPDGVQLRDHAQLQTVDVKGVGRMIVNPDQSTRLLIPEGVPLTAKQRDKYTEDAQALRAAQVELDAQTKLKAENPSKVGVTWFGGGTQGAVDDAKKKFDAAKAQVEGWHKDFPQLAAKNMPSTTQSTGAIPKVTTRAEYDALPVGADYFDDQGRRSKKRAPAPAAPAVP